MIMPRNGSDIFYSPVAVKASEFREVIASVSDTGVVVAA
jgi:hypothetical protein